MPASKVAWPVAVARHSSGPSTLSVPARTRSPGAFATGWLSPVSIASSADDVPRSTRPSTGTVSPAATRKRSPGFSSAIATSSQPSSTRLRAVDGCSASSPRIAAAARARARPSISFPSSTSVITIALASK